VLIRHWLTSTEAMSMAKPDATTLRRIDRGRSVSCTMRHVGPALLALAMTAGCAHSGQDSGSDSRRSGSQESPTQKSSSPRRTLSGVASVVCGGKRVEQVTPEETGRATSRGASCGNTDVWVFKDPSGRDAWVKIATEAGPVLVGTNWAVASDKRVLTVASSRLGGQVVRRQPRNGKLDENADHVDDDAFKATDCSETFARDDQKLLRKTCLENGGH
jgi:hypothetical protein